MFWFICILVLVVVGALVWWHLKPEGPSSWPEWSWMPFGGDHDGGGFDGLD